MIPLSYYLILSGIVFLTGVVGVLLRRNIIIILLSVELMLNATNINLVAVGLAIIIALYRAKSTINIDELQLLKW
jgi:NADH-quinone oxidoreductase subunit K